MLEGKRGYYENFLRDCDIKKLLIRKLFKIIKN